MLRRRRKSFLGLLHSVALAALLALAGLAATESQPSAAMLLLGGSSAFTVNADYTWSSTVTGVAKSAAAGYIAPVIFNRGSTIIPANYQGGMIYPVFSTGTVDEYFERVLGETGAISITLSTFASTNATAGTNYTSVSATLSWADGEIGWKKISIPILSIPTGFGLIGISATGSNVWRPNTWIWMQGTGRVPSAKFFQSSNGTNVNGNVSGSGTLASPWLGMSNALSTMGNAGGVLYWEQSGTTGHMEWGGTAGASTGVTVNGIQATTAAPLIVLPDPGNTSVATWDQGSTAGGANILFSNANCLNFTGSNAANLWFVGIHFTRCNVNFNNATVQSPGMVFWQDEFDNWSISGSNAAGLRADWTTYLIAQDDYFHEIYSTESVGTSNPFNSVPSSMEEGFQAFQAIGPSIAHCYAHEVEFGFMNKDSPVSGLGYDVTHSYGDWFAKKVNGSGQFVHLPVQGHGPWTSGTLVRYSVSDATGSPVQMVPLVGNESSTNPGDFLDVYNVVQIGNQGMLGGLYNVNDVRLFNSISQNSWGQEALLSVAAILTYSDKNLFVRTPTSALNWETHYNAGNTTYTTLPTWQAVTGDVNVQNNPDPNSAAQTTAPSYTNQSGKDYRWANTNGRGGRPIGVGNEFTGIVNTFLNAGLASVAVVP